MFHETTNGFPKGTSEKSMHTKLDTINAFHIKRFVEKAFSESEFSIKPATLITKIQINC